MIIVSQDGEKIINFNNITQVYITFDEDDYSFWVRIETVDSVYEDLGNYKTEERAKEVLEEIVKLYEEKDLTVGNMAYANANYPKVYRMPEV